MYVSKTVTIWNYLVGLDIKKENSAYLVVFNFFPLATVGVTVGVVVGVAVLIIMVYCAVHHLKRRRTPNRAAGVEYPMATTTTSASRSTQEPLQPAGNPSSPSVGYAPIPTNPPPPEYPHPLESPPRYPGKEGEPQYPPPGQSYPWQQ